jgi:hypothetical protein
VIYHVVKRTALEVLETNRSLMTRSFSIGQIFLALSFLLISAPAFSQTEYFIGTWTKEGTTYEFDFVLTIKHLDANNVQGQFNWTFAAPDDHSGFSIDYYSEKIGLTAVEYVRGNYDPANKEYQLHGYRKDDPNTIIALDEYRVKVVGEKTLRGTSRAHGSWLGIIDGERSTETAL